VALTIVEQVQDAVRADDGGGRGSDRPVGEFGAQIHGMAFPGGGCGGRVNW
jgi:hypothetical protein